MKYKNYIIKMKVSLRNNNENNKFIIIIIENNLNIIFLLNTSI